MSEWWSKGQTPEITVPSRTDELGATVQPTDTAPVPVGDLGYCEGLGEDHTVEMISCWDACGGYPHERCSRSHRTEDLDTCPNCDQCTVCRSCPNCDYCTGCEHVWRCDHCEAYFDEMGKGRDPQIFTMRQ